MSWSTTRSGKHNPSTPVRRAARSFAAPLGTYPSSAIAVSTLSLVSGSTRSRPASTRDTVAVDTPARLATA